MKKYISAFKIEFIHFFEYRSEFIAELISTFIQLSILLFFSLAIFENKSEVYGYSLSVFATYSLVSAALSKLINTDITWVLQEDIRRGSLSNALTKPIRYNIYRLFAEMSWKLHTISYQFIVISILSFVYLRVFKIELILERIPLFILAIILSYFLNRSFRFLIGCIAFWTKDIGGISNFLNEVISITGGKWLPLEFFGGLFIFFKFLPFSYIYYFPTQILINNDFAQRDIINVFLMLISWTILFTVISAILWKRGIRHFESVGI